MAIRSVPPFLSLGLYVPVTAELYSAFVASVPPPDPLSPELSLPPQAARLKATAALTAVAVVMRFHLIFCCTPFFVRARLPGWREVLSRSRVEGIAQPVTEQVEGQHRDEDGEAGRDHVERRDLVPIRRDGQHVAPAGRRRPDSDAQVRQTRLEQHV